MIVSISTKTFDINGDLRLISTGSSVLQNRVRRVSKVPTLDGGVALVDNGYTDGDRDFRLSVMSISAQELDALIRLMSNYSLLNIATNTGYFSGSILSVKSDKLPVEITILLKESLL